MYPIHLSRKLASVTKIPHYTAQREKLRIKQQQRAEEARESRSFRAIAKTDLLGLPPTNLARFIANNFTIAHLSNSQPVILPLYLAKLYPPHYYATHISLLHKRKKRPHSTRVLHN